MLSMIRLHNFKSFKQLDSLAIKPITILCGSNSCGKSSILQSLLMVKQTKESRNVNQSLLLNGKYVHLGDIENIVYGHDGSNNISINFEYEFTMQQFYTGMKSSGRRGSSFYLFRYLLPDSVRKLTDAKHKISINLVFRPSGRVRGYINTADIQKYEVFIATTPVDKPTFTVANVILEKKENGFGLVWKNIHSPQKTDQNMASSGSAENLRVTFENLYPLVELKENNEDFYERIPFQVTNFLRAIDDFLTSINESIAYIGPLREEPSRRYIYENEVLDIGVKGENAAYIFQTEQDKEIFKSHFFDEKKQKYYEKDKSTLSKSLAEWLEYMGIAGLKPDSQSEIIRLNMKSNEFSQIDVNIADVGFGVSQIFPILLEGLRMPNQGTLLLEQPEIHLHPSLQMKMADYFIALALSGKNVIVETHSDHVVNRLVRRILEAEDSHLSDLVAIYFVSSSGEGAYIEEVIIDECAGIKNWPDGFFDQTAKEQEQIMLAGIRKRKKKREAN